MLCITKITLHEILLPLKEPFQISSGTEKDRRILLLQLEAGDGFTGWSECVAAERPNYSPETVDTAWLAIREWLAPRVVGRRFQRPEDVHHALQEDLRGHYMAKAAVEMGARELAAQMEGTPLARFLGGVRDKIATGISLGIQDTPTLLVEKARTALEQGYAKIKIKIKPGADIEYISAVREALGPDAPLMADANSAYMLNDLSRLKELDRFGLMMIEQPLAWNDLVRHAELQRQIATPICLDESIISLESAEDMVALGSGRIVNIKPGRVGGFTSSLAIHDFCGQNQVAVWCGGMLESGIGRAYNVALASLPNFTLPGDISPSQRYWEQDIVQPEWVMDHQGMVAVPLDKPGMGVTVDLDRIDDLTVRQEILIAQL